MALCNEPLPSPLRIFSAGRELLPHRRDERLLDVPAARPTSLIQPGEDSPTIPAPRRSVTGGIRCVTAGSRTRRERSCMLRDLRLAVLVWQRSSPRCPLSSVTLAGELERGEKAGKGSLQVNRRKLSLQKLYAARDTYSRPRANGP
jgi:hypothetical protein